MKQLNTLAALLLCVCFSHAQSYQFELDNDLYYAIVGGTLVTDSFTENAYTVGAPGFRAFDKPLGDVFVVGKNGFVVNTNMSAGRSFAFDPLIAGLRKHATLQSELRVLIYLPPGTNDSIFIVEWENMGLENMPDEDYVNFQMWLHRPSQTIEFRYGQSLVSSDSLLAENGGVSADIALLNAGFTVSYEHHAFTGNPQSPSISTDPGALVTLDAVPPAGTVYRFTKIATGVASLGDFALNVYPNPFDGCVVVQNHDARVPTYYNVYNAMGQKLEHGKLLSPTLDLKHLPAGFYTLELEQNQLRSRVRLVKK